LSVKEKETAMIGVSGAISICGRNIHANIIHNTINKCEVTVKIIPSTTLINNSDVNSNLPFH
jgi:uncharacterized membrane protein YecN with MAPEG domain